MAKFLIAKTPKVYISSEDEKIAELTGASIDFTDEEVEWVWVAIDTRLIYKLESYVDGKTEIYTPHEQMTIDMSFMTAIEKLSE